MRRALLAFLGLVGLYGCYDYTLPTPPAASEDPKASAPDKKSDGGPLNPSSVDDAPAPAMSSTSDAGSDATTTPTATSCAMKCANGCVNGACNPPTKCVAGGTYCGGDKVNGDPDVLYKCGADGFATTVQRACANGCTVAPAGQDDYCN